MPSFNLFIDAVKLIWFHRLQVLRIMLPYLLIQVALFALMSTAAPHVLIISETHSDTDYDGYNLYLFFFILLSIIIVSIMTLILAVVWHRIVLSPEKIKPPFSCLASYLLWLFVLSVLCGLVIQIPSLVPTSYVANEMKKLSNEEMPAFFKSMQLPFLAFSFCITTFASWLWLRLGLILPAAAVEMSIEGQEKTDLGTSWAATKNSQYNGSWGGGLLGFALIISTIQIALQYVQEATIQWAPYLTAIIYWSSAIVVVTAAFIGLSALSILYREAGLEKRQ